MKTTLGIKTVNEWQSAEHFIYDTMPILFVIGAFALFLLFFLLLYTKKSRFKWKFGWVLVLLALLGGMGLYAVNQHAKYQWYAEAKPLLTPAIRTKEKKLLKEATLSELAPKVYDLPKIEALGLYTKEAMVEKGSLTYVGETEYLYYFKVFNKLYKINKQADFLLFKEGLSEPQFVGFNFTLNKPEYTQLGFLPKIGPLYTNIEVPLADQDKTYEHTAGETDEFSY